MFRNMMNRNQRYGPRMHVNIKCSYMIKTEPKTKKYVKDQFLSARGNGLLKHTSILSAQLNTKHGY